MSVHSSTNNEISLNTLRRLRMPPAISYAENHSALICPPASHLFSENMLLHNYQFSIQPTPLLINYFFIIIYPKTTKGVAISPLLTYLQVFNLCSLKTVNKNLNLKTRLNQT